MASIVEANHDKNGIIWPESVAPYKVYLAELAKGKAEEVYKKLSNEGIEVLYDDREVSAGIKFSDADLLGFPYRIVVSEKTGDKIEVRRRGQKESRLITIDNIMLELRK